MSLITSLLESPLGGGGTSAPAAVNAEVQSWHLATGSLSSQTTLDALDTFVTECKAQSCWTNWIAMYPFLGGTEAAHRVSLCDSTQYGLDFVGGVTHNAAGVLFNGTTGYANTRISMAIELAHVAGAVGNCDFWIARYVHTNIAAASAGKIEGCYYLQSGSVLGSMYWFPWHTSSNSVIHYYGNDISSSVLSNSGSKKAYHHVVRQTQASPVTQLRENGNTNAGPSSSAGASLPLAPYLIAARAEQSYASSVAHTVSSHCDIGYSFYAIGRGNGPNSTQITAFHTAVTALMAALGRTVTP